MFKIIKISWMLIIPDSKLLEPPLPSPNPKLILKPMLTATHIGIDEAGKFTLKVRVAHDFSFPGFISGESVDSRTIEDNLEPIMFGFSLIQVIHYIVHLHSKFPWKIIWIREEDLKLAFGRIHMNGNTCFKSAVRVKINGSWHFLILL